MKRLYIILLGFWWAIGAYAFDKQALADTLTRYVNQTANVGKININRVFVKNVNITVQASKNLEWAPLTANQISHIRLICSQYINGNENSRVSIFTNGYELGELESGVDLYSRNQNLPRQKRYMLSQKTEQLTKNISLPYSVENGLQDMHLAVYGSHGLYYNQQEQRWIFQRAKLLTTVEDLYTSSYTIPFLVPMLENAGAVVLQPRERDTQTEEVIVDDSRLRLPEGWSRTAANGWGQPTRPLAEAENPFLMGGYVYADMEQNKHSESVLMYYPPISKEGDYAVYVSYKTLPNSTDAAEYTVMHSGISTVFRVNQQMGGSTWIYLGTFRFSAASNQNYISVSNRGRAGSVVTSDAVRLGGGMGSVGRYPYTEDAVEEQQVSNYPRYIEGARYWLQYAGIPDSVYNFSKGQNDYTDDFASRGRWINYLCGGSETNPQGVGLRIPIHAALAFHTDAGLTPNDSIVGTLAIYTDYNNDKKKTYPTGSSRLAARRYGDYIQTQVVEDIRATYAPEWQRRELKNASYSETRNPEVPTIILELLAHQNLADMRYGLDPRFRFLVSRAVYKGILKYLHEQHSTDYVVQPLPIQKFKIDFAKEQAVRLSWQETIDTLETTAQPTYYVVYTREDDGDWDNGTRVVKAEYTLNLKKNTRYDFRVVAGNKGGVSLPSETLSAYLSANEVGRVMVINGFNRLSAPQSFSIDSTYAGFAPMSYSVPYGKELCYTGAQYDFSRADKWVSDDDGGFGASFMNHAHIYTMGNTFDYPVMHGRVLAKEGYSFVSSSAAAVDSVSSDISIVDVIMGKQLTTTIGTVKKITDFKTFPTHLQEALSDYLMRGGNMLVSGAYITTDLKNNAEDKDFMQRCLHANYVSGNATRLGKIETTKLLPRKVLHLNTEPNEYIIHAEAVEALQPYGKTAWAVARYTDSNTTAAVAWDGENRTLFFGFPLESIEEFEDIYTKSIKWLFSNEKEESANN